MLLKDRETDRKNGQRRKHNPCRWRMYIFGMSGPCITTAIWRCCNPFSQLAAQFSKKAAILLAKILATASCQSGKTGSRCQHSVFVSWWRIYESVNLATVDLCNRMHLGHVLMLSTCFRVLSLNFVRKYRNATVYMVCASATWFITIKTMLEFMRRHSLAKGVIYSSVICIFVTD